MVTPDIRTRALIAAEASAWLARIQNDERTPETEAAFQEWLRANSLHTDAFERATELWEMVPGAVALSAERAPKPQVVRAIQKPKANTRMVLAGAIAASVVAAIVVVAHFNGASPIVYETAAGEQQVRTLPDGSRVVLNTDSRIAVAYSGGKRRITLTRGEVLFEVEHNPAQPFLVRAGNEQVRALGTSFVVRSEPDKVAVTLIKGSVEVANRVSTSLLGDKYVPQVTLSPGQRASVDAEAHVRLDRPSPEAVIAWRRGEVIFSNTSLLEAVSELNRYSKIKLSVADERVARLRVSGIFETNNATEFAQSMARLHGLTSRRSGDQIELAR